MNKLLLKTIFLVFLFSCSQDENSTLEEFVTGAKIAGVNGIHFGPDGMLYAASVIGSDISVINTETGEIINLLFKKHKRVFDSFWITIFLFI